MAFDFKAVKPEDLKEAVTKAPARGRTSRGQVMLEEFLASGQVAATVTFSTPQERNSLKTSAMNFQRKSGVGPVWVRNSGDTGLMLINVEKAPADVKKAYEGRPKGPGSKK